MELATACTKQTSSVRYAGGTSPWCAGWEEGLAIRRNTDVNLTGENTAIQKGRNERDRLLEAGVCDACQLFGCTGWSRKFRLQLSDGSKLLERENILIPSGRKHQTRKGERAGGWFVFTGSHVCEIVFNFIPLRDADLRPIHIILALISRQASLGPKGASGYGVIQPKDVKPELDWIQVFGNQPPDRKSALPHSRDFFFARFQFQEPNDDANWWKAINGI